MSQSPDDHPNEPNQTPVSTQPPAKRQLPKGRAGRKDRRDRFTPSGDVSVRLENRDIEIFRLIDKHRLVESRQLTQAFARESNARAFSDRLSRLFHAGYIDRPLMQKRPGQPAKHCVYAIGPEARRHLDELDEVVRTGRRDIRAENKRLKSALFLAHEIAITETLLTFQLAATRQGWQFSSAREDEFHTVTGLPSVVEITFMKDVRKPLPLRPDGFITIDTGDDQHRYLIEVDLGTEPQGRWSHEQSSIHRKILAYRQLSLWRIKERFDGVIFVTTTPTRIDGMIEKVRQVGPNVGKGTHFFQFALLDDLRMEKETALFYARLFRSAKFGYPNARPLFLDACPTCHESVDPANERWLYLNTDPPIAYDPTLEPVPSDAVIAHAACPSLSGR